VQRGGGGAPQPFRITSQHQRQQPRRTLRQSAPSSIVCGAARHTHRAAPLAARRGRGMHTPLRSPTRKQSACPPPPAAPALPPRLPHPSRRPVLPPTNPHTQTTRAAPGCRVSARKLRAAWGGGRAGVPLGKILARSDGGGGGGSHMKGCRQEKQDGGVPVHARELQTAVHEVEVEQHPERHRDRPICAVHVATQHGRQKRPQPTVSLFSHSPLPASRASQHRPAAQPRHAPARSDLLDMAATRFQALPAHLSANSSPAPTLLVIRLGAHHTASGQLIRLICSPET